VTTPHDATSPAPRRRAGRARTSRTAKRIASLPMYDLPELAWANDALWTGLAERLRAAGVEGVPDRLARGAPLASLWTDPDLLLAQTCGYPLVKALAGKVQLVATPRYHARGCDGPFHRSAVVVRTENTASGLADLRGACCALNDPASNTGMNLLRAEVAPLANGGAFFGKVVVTGSHAASAEAVAEGAADLAAIDAVTFAQLQRHRPQAVRRLRVLMWTMRSPGLPLITSALTDPATLRALIDGLDDIARDPALRAARAELLLEGFHVLPKAHYRAVLYLEQIAQAQGFEELH
jgi:ABC-type phosphate/phosphonate transport system substrate-binding protein